MSEERIIRINKVLRELNISLEKAINIFKLYNIKIESNPNTKINLEQYNILIQHLKKPSKIREIEDVIGRILFYKDKSFSSIDSNFYILNEESKIIGLDIFEANIKNLNFLKTEKQIQYLSLSNCNLTNIEILSELNNLEKLDLSFDPIIDYKPIQKLNHLKELKISNVSISNFEFLTDNIIKLSLIECNLKNISFLSEYKNIECLDLSHNEIEDLTPLINLTKIYDLDLSHNKIFDLSPLKVFKRFCNLNLSNNFIEDIFPLKNVKFECENEELAQVYIGNNKIFDLSPFYKQFKEDSFHLNHFGNPIIYPPINFNRLNEIEKFNWFEKGLENARKKIENVKNKKSTKLNLGNLGLTDLSYLPELFDHNDHIEELIISNHYAKYDSLNNVWIQEKSTSYYPNNISNIPNEIIKLKNLKVLIIGGDWRENDQWKRWRVENVDFLKDLKKLEVINISNNQVIELPSLSTLKNLKSIHANNNFIAKIGSLNGLLSLEEIYLSNNKINDLKFLGKLENLKTLDLHNNKINDILPLKNIINKIGIEDSKWNVGTVNIKNNDIDEAFINIVRATSGIKRINDLKNYFKRIEQGKYVEVKKLKLILIGNTGAGKTTLADILSKEKKANLGSTHGVNFFDFDVEDIKVKGYDFGGQDYYHNTHYSFFDNKALYIIVWGNGQKNEFEFIDGENLFPLNYWLGSLNVYTFSDIIHKFYEQLLILRQQNNFNQLGKLNELLEKYQFPILKESFSMHDIEEFIKETNISLNNIKRIISKIAQEIERDFDNEKHINRLQINAAYPFSAYIFQNVNDYKVWLNELDLKSSFSFINDFLTFNFHDSKPQIEKVINTIAKNFTVISKQPKIDFELGEEFTKNKSKVLIKLKDVSSLKEELQLYSTNQLESLLNSLHSTLACYYFKIERDIIDKLDNKNLENIVILDIEKFTDWIYRIFEQRNLSENQKKSNRKIFSLDKEGYFTKEDAVSWLNDQIAIENIDYILAFMLQNKMIFKIKNHNWFFSPNYLPEIQSQTEKLFLNSFNSPIVKYIFNGHFHTSVLSEIIDKYMDNLVQEDNKIKYVLWKNKILLYEEECNISKLVYLNLEILCSNSPSISISKFNDSVSDSFILEICHFIEKIIKNYDYRKMILSKNGNYIPYDVVAEDNFGQDNKKTNLFSYENVIYRRSDFKMFFKPDNTYPMKKIFISYSKDDLTLVNQFQDHLAPLKRDGLIASWYCTELIAGGEWDKDIQQHFNESDIVCFMVSPNLMKTDYVFHHEIKKAIERKKNDENFKIVPIILNFCSWITKDYNLGNYTALPYTAKPVCDFSDKNMAWYIIIECLKILINSKKQPSGDNWYNNNLPKDTKKIYERIVEGKVDNNT